MTIYMIYSEYTGSWPDWPNKYTDLSEAIRRAHTFQHAYPERRYRVEALSSEHHGGRTRYVTLSQQLGSKREDGMPEEKKCPQGGSVLKALLFLGITPDGHVCDRCNSSYLSRLTTSFP